ncbi:hypothetical protein [Actinocrinis sp.]|uniref:hypothetical protein n=1 Tax=Actinocrinis sp. TaxID=1920516 RepID=UPI002D4D15F0|nr:hypothetical protein [Actinocrinis sp.]HZP51957.1 hypothetical protein [Actinocrinis sp.]
MGDFIIRTGDQVQVTIPPPAVVPALQGPAPLEGSSATLTVCGMKACLVGDELPAQLRGALAYTSGSFTNAGTGTLTLTLTPANTTQRTRNGAPILIKGGSFTATFTVVTPATQTTPAGPVPDPVTVKSGSAQFLTTNTSVRAG